MKQLELLPSAAPEISQDEVAWMISVLTGRGWMLASEILQEAGLEDSDSKKRRLRKIASESGGRIGGGQKGYKLVAQMTAEEYGHFDRWMAHQEAEMQRRRMEASIVFHQATNPHRIPIL